MNEDEREREREPTFLLVNHQCFLSEGRGATAMPPLNPVAELQINPTRLVILQRARERERERKFERNANDKYPLSISVLYNLSCFRRNEYEKK